MLICPICKTKLILKNKTYTCDNNHCYDLSKKGYENLLLSQSNQGKIHGDDKLMTQSRRDFLNSGHYEKLKDIICKKTSPFNKIVDVGCGEGYYTCSICEFHKNKASVVGIDISKDIISASSSRSKDKNVVFAVANCKSIPIADRSCDCIVSVFAPVNPPEFNRILNDSGVIIRVTPGVDHLFELKEKVYETPRKNEPVDLTIDGFDVVSSEILKYIFVTNNKQTIDLFTMAPYYYKTSETDRNKLNNISSLEITAEFEITTYKKRTV